MLHSLPMALGKLLKVDLLLDLRNPAFLASQAKPWYWTRNQRVRVTGSTQYLSPGI